MPISHEELSQMLANNPSLRIARENRPQTRPKPRQADSSFKQETLSQRSAGLQEPVSGRARQPKTDYKAILVQQCELIGLKMEPEFKFCSDRKFRADWRVHRALWKGKKPTPSNVLVEYEGGVFSAGKRGHSSVAGIRRDIEKSNLAQILGYKVIRVTPDHVVSGQALKWIEDALR